MLWKGNASLIGCKGTKKNAHAQAKKANFMKNASVLESLLHFANVLSRWILLCLNE